MKRIIAVTGVVLILMGIFPACGFQRALLYQPERFDMETLQRYVRQVGLEPWPVADSSYLGLVRRNGEGEPRGTVVVFHGNAGAAVHRSYYADALVSRGFRVIIAEYPGYGARSGEMSEEEFVREARRVTAEVRDRLGGPVYLWGESLGSAVAAAAVSDPSVAVDGLVLITPWDSLYNLARAKMPIIPVRFFMKDRYDSVENLADYTGPVAVLMAERDEIIPARLTRRLYESLPGSKRLWLFENVGHNTWPTSPGSEWWDQVLEYLEQGSQGSAG